MDIHRYEKIWLGLSVLLIVGFISTIAYGAVGAGVEMISDSGGSIDPDNVNEHEQFEELGVEQVGEHEYEVSVVAQQFFFNANRSDPLGPIRVPADSTVTFYVTSPDVTHGFQLVGTNVNTMVIPGQISEITVEFDEPGQYGLICHEYCGPGHETMAGEVIVVPESEWEGDSA